MFGNYFAVRIVEREDGRRIAHVHSAPDAKSGSSRWLIFDADDVFIQIIRALIPEAGRRWEINNPGNSFWNQWYILDNREA